MTAAFEILIRSHPGLEMLGKLVCHMQFSCPLMEMILPTFTLYKLLSHSFYPLTTSFVHPTHLNITLTCRKQYSNTGLYGKWLLCSVFVVNTADCNSGVILTISHGNFH